MRLKRCGLFACRILSHSYYYLSYHISWTNTNHGQWYGFIGPNFSFLAFFFFLSNFAVSQIYEIAKTPIFSIFIFCVGLFVTTFGTSKFMSWMQSKATVKKLYMGRSPPMLTDMRVLQESSDGDHLVNISTLDIPVFAFFKILPWLNK